MEDLFTEFTPAQEMESTKKATADRNGWVTYLEDRDLRQGDRVYAFTDGSSSGYHSAALIWPEQQVRFYSRFTTPDHTRNVGAELNGLLLAIEQAPENSKLTIVSDYIGVGAWMIGAWFINDAEVQSKITKAQRIAEEKGVLGTLRFIHHGGHQRDDTALTLWNTVADRLCCQSPPWPTAATISWASLEIHKDGVLPRDKAALRLIAEASGDRNKKSSHWRVVSKASYMVSYDWVDPVTETIGKCSLGEDGRWDQAPASENPVLLTYVGR